MYNYIKSPGKCERIDHSPFKRNKEICSRRRQGSENTEERFDKITVRKHYDACVGTMPVVGRRRKDKSAECVRAMLRPSTTEVCWL